MDHSNNNGYYSKLHIRMNTAEVISIDCQIDIKTVWAIICENMPELCSIEQKSTCAQCKKKDCY